MSQVESEYIVTALQAIDDVSDELREISLKIHGHPELAFEEHYAHEILVKYLEEKGFDVSPSAYGLATAFVAEFHSKTGKGRVISFNSEYDALPGIGHACGHNLIAISGVGAAIGIKAILEKFDIPGTVKLIGTPAEETGDGKVRLLEAGAYEGVDVSLMIHPTMVNGAFIKTLAAQSFSVEYFGKPAHASAVPWEGVNALDAMVSAYNNVGLLRQHILPTNRIHGIITDGGKFPNVIPDHTSGKFIIRAATAEDLRNLRPRVVKCFEAAAEATGARLELTWGTEVCDVKVNEPLATKYESYMRTKLEVEILPKEFQLSLPGASTDQGNVTYAIPGFHPFYSIHVDRTNFNHTPGFTEVAGNEVAHVETIKATKGMTLVGLDVLIDEEFAKEVKASFEETKAIKLF